MTLLPKSIEKMIPALYATDGVPLENKTVVAKFFDPSGRSTWYVFEGSREGADIQFFGFVKSALGPDCDEMGYFSLRELQSLRGRLGLRMERDAYFQPTRFADLAEVSL